MANTGFKGINCRQTGTALLFDGFLQDGTGNILTGGTTTLYIYEVQSDATLKSYDFSSNTFKTTALTSETASMSHQTGNNGGTNTGYWSYALATLTGFTVGAVYLYRVRNTNASPVDQLRKFIYGSAEGDLVVTANGTGAAELNADVVFWKGATAPANTGDAYARIGANGSGLTAVALTSAYDPAKTASQAGDAMSLTSGERTTLAAAIWNALTSGMATAGSIGKLLVDNITASILSVYNRLGAPAGASLSADIAANLTAVNNLNNLSALANLFSPSTMVRPASGSIVYPFTFVVKDVEGHLVDVDSNTVTLTATNATGTDRSANLSAVTHAGTGEYTFTYTVSSSHADEGLRFTASGTVQSATRKAYSNAEVADADSLADIAAIKAKTDLIGTTSADSSNITGIKSQTDKIGTTAADSSNVTGIKAKTDQLTFTVANQVDANSLTGGLTQAQVRSAVGLGAANMDTQLNAIYTVAGLVQAKTDNLPAHPADRSDIPSAATVANAVGALDLTGPLTTGTLAATIRDTESLAGNASSATTDDTFGNQAIQTLIGTSGNAGTIGGAIDVAIAEANAAHNIVADATSGNVALLALLTEMHGLIGKNSGLRNTVYSGRNLVSYDVCLYDNADDAATNDGSTGLLHQYTITNTYDGGGNLLTSVTEKVS